MWTTPGTVGTAPVAGAQVQCILIVSRTVALQPLYATPRLGLEAKDGWMDAVCLFVCLSLAEIAYGLPIAFSALYMHCPTEPSSDIWRQLHVKTHSAFQANSPSSSVFLGPRIADCVTSSPATPPSSIIHPSPTAQQPATGRTQRDRLTWQN